MKGSRKIKYFLCIALLFFSILVFLTPQSAHATATLKLIYGLNSVTVADGGAGDLDSNPGVVTYVGALGCFNINITTGATYPDIGSLSFPVLNLADVNVTATNSGTLTIMFSETGFGPTGSADFVTHAVGGTADSVTFSSYYDSSNTLFGQGTSVGALGPYTHSFFNDTITSSGNPSTPYSLTEIATISYTTTPVDATAFSMNLSVVPEPVSSTLFVIGGALLVFRRIRKTKKA